MTVEQGEDEGGSGGGAGGDNFRAQTSSTYHSYPPPLATYENVVCSRDLFMDSLKKLHISMGTKFMEGASSFNMIASLSLRRLRTLTGLATEAIKVAFYIVPIPIVGGRDLDLHRLFVEVTSRGGIAKILKERKWKEVTAVFSFPSSATNASFILRKYYVSLLYHYEQIYFFKAKCWTPSPTDAMQTLSTITPPPFGLPEFMPSASQRTHAASPQQQAQTSTTPQVSLTPSSGSPVHGVIDGKFESGYLITVKIGSEEFKGVLYQVPNSENQHGGMFQTQINQSSLKSGAPRRKRRKKSEIRKRDPAHPKPNRSGYNFFFAEQHARLKPHYHGKDREISRIIGESWNKLQEPERAVYQEKALRDKERYRAEMEVYKERLRTGQITTATPAQIPEVSLTDLNRSLALGAAASACNDGNEMSSDKSNMGGIESGDKYSDCGETSQADMELKNVDIEVMVEEGFDKEEGKIPSRAEDGMTVPVEGIGQAPSIGNESLANL